MSPQKPLLHLRSDPMLKPETNLRKAKKGAMRLYCTLHPKCTWYTSVRQDKEERKQTDNDVRLMAAVNRRNKHLIEKHNERMPWG
jgi:hypothetical protein